MAGFNFVMGRDINGNKIVRVKPQWKAQGFSIQTMGNLPKTHRSNMPDENEITGWVKLYGTLRQKELFGVY